jgi:hypothetical protein
MGFNLEQGWNWINFDCSIGLNVAFGNKLVIFEKKIRLKTKQLT